MKILLLLIPFLMILPASAQMLSDRTGLKSVFDVVVDGQSHKVDVIGNFDAMDLRFKNGNLTLDIFSSLSNNIGEMQIPHEVTGGTANYYLDGEMISPKVLKNQLISFVTLEFEGNGTHTLVVEGIDPQSETPEVLETVESNASDYLSVVIAAAVAAVVIGAILVYKKRNGAFGKTSTT